MFKFVGVLLYYLHDNRIYIVLGQDSGEGWNIFGGGPESPNILSEAIREFEEETMGVFGNVNISDSPSLNIRDAIIYLVQLDFNPKDYITAYNNIRRTIDRECECTQTYLEMSELQMFDTSSISIDELRYPFSEYFNDLIDILYSFVARAQ